MFHIKNSPVEISLWLGLIAVFTLIQLEFLTGPLLRDPIFGLLNLFVGIAAIAGIASNSRASSCTSVNLFVLVMMCIIPTVEHAYAVTYWGASSVILDTYRSASLVTLLSIITFNFVYYFRINQRTELRILRKNAETPKLRVKPVLLIIASASAVLASLAYNGFSVGSMFVRGGILTEKVELDGMTTLIYKNFIYPIPCICLVIYALHGGKRLAPMAVLSALFLFGNFPTGTARFQAAAMYMSVLIAVFPAIRRSNIIIPSTMLLGLTVILPTLDQFRRYDGEGFSIRTLSFKSLTAGHFDSFQSVAGALNMDMTGGRQLLGALFFWVPRSIWSNKPIGSGALYAEQHRLFFSNISMNFFGEGIVNFGAVGAVAFAAVGAYIVASIDRRRDLQNLYPSYATVAIFLIGFAFFIMRGDLMNGTAYTLGTVAAIVMITKFATSSRLLPRLRI